MTGKHYPLANQIAMLPTPKSQNANHPGEHGQGGKDLQTVVSLLPTPKQRDWKGETQRGPDAPMDGLQNTLAAASGKTKQDRGKNNGLKLQPAFVEWMQGYPIGWTDLKH